MTAPMLGRLAYRDLPCECCNRPNKRKTKRAEQRRARREADNDRTEQ